MGSRVITFLTRGRFPGDEGFDPVGLNSPTNDFSVGCETRETLLWWSVLGVLSAVWHWWTLKVCCTWFVFQDLVRTDSSYVVQTNDSRKTIYGG